MQIGGSTGRTVVGMEVERPQTFNGTLSNILKFMTAYKLYIKMKMREVAVEKQIQ